MTQATLTVPAAEANRQFSRLLRAAREGTRITITSHGEPVAELSAVGGESTTEAATRKERRAAHEALMTHLRTTPPIVIGSWTRDELYDRG